jgi:hypothetical protein
MGLPPSTIKRGASFADRFGVGQHDDRGHDVGLRDATVCRNLGLLALGFAVSIGVNAVGQHRSRFGFGADSSFAITSALIGAYLLWCWRFIIANLARPTSYFRAFDARHLWSTNVAFFGVGPFLADLAAITYFGNERLVSGLLVGPASVLVPCAIGRLTGGVRPL